MKARRISRGELVADTPRDEPDYHLCGNCEKAQAARDDENDTTGVYAEIVAPSGTTHLAEGPKSDTTLCGQETEGW
jgi:hypothetical protein